MFAVHPTTAPRHRSYPSISLLVRVTGPTPWRARLRGLQRDAATRLRDEFSGDTDTELLARLEHAVAGAVAPRGAHSIAVFVNANGSQCVGLAVPVRERCVIDDTFATRDLVLHDLRAASYWVLALSLDDPRLLRGHGETLTPTLLELRDATPHPASPRYRRDKHRSDVIDANRTRRIRAIDMALTETLGANRDPLFVVGAEPTLSLFLDRTRHSAHIEGVIRRAPAPNLAVLARIIRPAISELLNARRAKALSELDRAVGAGSAASGIDQVWRAARRRNMGLLIVEHGFEHPAAVATTGLLTAASDAAAIGVVDDVVDEAIELVLATGGRAEIVPDGTLTAHQRIAFVPNFRSKR